MKDAQWDGVTEEKREGRRMGRKNIRSALLYLVCSVLIIIGLEGSVSEAEGFYENSFLSFSPDQGAWTVREELPNAGDAKNRINPSCWYGWNEVILTEKTSSIEEPEAWEHYYRYNRKGLVPIRKWTLAHREGRCIHKEQFPFHNLDFTSYCCGSSYYSGWNAYCADCGEKVLDFNIYMSKSKVARITEVDTRLDYYYLCPTCKHLEQGRGVHHMCKAISANRYRVQYLPNGGNVAGFMQSSFHMYNNAEWFEGEPVTPIKKLNRNTFSREGYLFIGWNTEPDGSGLGFTDEQEIWNLTEDNYDPESNKGTVCLYAQWKKVTYSITYKLDGGKNGSNPKSYTVTTSTITLKSPSKKGYTFKGWYSDSKRTKKITKITKGSTGDKTLYAKWSKDTYKITYKLDGGKNGSNPKSYTVTTSNITLKNPTRKGYTFKGWYSDKKLTKKVTKITKGSTGNKTLYAKWKKK